MIALRRLAAVDGPDDERPLLAALRGEARRLLDEAGKWADVRRADGRAYHEFADLVDAGAAGDHARAREISKLVRGRLSEVANDLLVSAATGYLRCPTSTSSTPTVRTPRVTRT